MKVIALLLLWFSWPATSQIIIEEDSSYFKHGSNRYRLNRSTLSKADEQRIFSDHKPNLEINNFLRSRPPQKADLKDAMSDVRNQGQRGTCSHFATLGLVEHFYDKNSDLSEQCLSYFADAKDSSIIKTQLEYISSSGVHRETDCPYRDPGKHDEWFFSNPTQRLELAKKYRDDIPDLKNAKKIYPSYEMTSKHVDSFSDSELIQYIQTQINAGLPVGAALYVFGDQWDLGLIDKIPTKEEIEKACRQKESSALSNKKECDSHAIVFTGFDDSRRVFLFKNSWDKPWGLDDNYQITKNFLKKIGYGAISHSYFAKFRLNHLITLSQK